MKIIDDRRPSLLDETTEAVGGYAPPFPVYQGRLARLAQGLSYPEESAVSLARVLHHHGLKVVAEKASDTSPKRQHSNNNDIRTRAQVVQRNLM